MDSRSYHGGKVSTLCGGEPVVLFNADNKDVARTSRPWFMGTMPMPRQQSLVPPLGNLFPLMTTLNRIRL